MLSVTSQAQVKQPTGRFDMFRKLFRRQDRHVDQQQSEKSPNGVKPSKSKMYIAYCLYCLCPLYVNC